MAIALRGTSQTGNANNGGNVTLTFDTITPPLVDDIVVVFGGHGKGVTTLAAPGTGYTQIGIHTGSEPIFGAWYKRMGATPDLTVLCSGGGDSNDGVAYGSVVYSGVDTVTAEDVTATTAGPTTSTNPDPASITTVTANAFVLAMAGSAVFDSSPGTIIGYTDQITSTRNETNDLTAAFARVDAGAVDAEDPGAWDTWASGGWYAITAALRPATSPLPVSEIMAALAGKEQQKTPVRTPFRAVDVGHFTFDMPEEGRRAPDLDWFQPASEPVRVRGKAQIAPSTIDPDFSTVPVPPAAPSEENRLIGVVFSMSPDRVG